MFDRVLECVELWYELFKNSCLLLRVHDIYNIILNINLIIYQNIPNQSPFWNSVISFWLLFHFDFVVSLLLKFAKMLEHEADNVFGLLVYDFDHHVAEDGFNFLVDVLHFAHGLLFLGVGFSNLGDLSWWLVLVLLAAATARPVHDAKIIKIELLGFEPRTFCV